ARDAVSSAVQTALSLYAASQISQGAAESYPADLDGEDDGIAADREHPLFDIILKGGVIKSWTKQDDNCYQYTGGAGTDEYQYDSTAPDPVGTFVYVSAGC
ncbi:MAG TPA: hypothetical protein VJC18_05650, partial [bacterium]|nr:hypothetical protein [bacterium]